jgi:hypothetical protein
MSVDSTNTPRDWDGERAARRIQNLEQFASGVQESHRWGDGSPQRPMTVEERLTSLEETMTKILVRLNDLELLFSQPEDAIRFMGIEDFKKQFEDVPADDAGGTFEPED